MPLPNVGVIGTGAMGLGVVQSLVRGGYRVFARDIRPEAEAASVASGALARGTPAALARECSIIILLVVDAAQIDVVLFADDGVATAITSGTIIVASSTVAPAYVRDLESKLARYGARLLDAPVSGGPRRAADGTMTIMLAGDASAAAECEPVFAAIAAKRFSLGSRPGDAATFKILNNQLAAANLTAGAEAMALAMRAGIDPRRFLEVVNASSGASWIFADRMARALEGDYAPRAATQILTKDIGIAIEAAAALDVDAPLACRVRETFLAAVAAGYGDEDDASLLKLCCDRAGIAWPRQ